MTWTWPWVHLDSETEISPAQAAQKRVPAMFLGSPNPHAAAGRLFDVTVTVAVGRVTAAGADLKGRACAYARTTQALPEAAPGVRVSRLPVVSFGTRTGWRAGMARTQGSRSPQTTM